VERPENVLSLVVEFERHTLRSIIDELRLVKCNPCSLRIISSVQCDLGIAAGISLTGHDDDLVGSGEGPIVTSEDLDQLEYRYPARRILYRRQLSYRDGCRQDYFPPKDFDQIFPLFVIK
jgi:hypothetical protein